MVPKVSILIPTKNGEEYLEECLNMVFKQKTDFDYEVICVDSGSKDRTLEIINKFQNKYFCHSEGAVATEESQSNALRSFTDAQDDKGGIKIFQILPQEFGHGRTRNLAASKAQGEFLVFLTQDAISANESWLENIIKPLKEDVEVAGVFGRHLPRKDCDPFQRKSINDFMESLKNNLTCQLSGSGDREQEFEKNKNKLAFFSNVNSAIRRSVWEKIPFQDVEMGEDQFWAKDILLAGYKKDYAPEAKVYHSHNYGIWNQFKRWFDEYCQHKKNLNYVGVSAAYKIPYLALRLWINDVKYIRRQNEYNFGQKIYWTLWIFFMDLARFSAEYLGARYDKLPVWMQNSLSMQYELIHKK